MGDGHKMGIIKVSKALQRHEHISAGLIFYVIIYYISMYIGEVEFMSIRNKLVYSIILFVIMPMLFMPAIVYYAYEDILKNKINSSTQQTLAQVANSMGAVIDNMIAASNMLSLDKELVEILQKQDYSSEWGKYYEQSKIYDKLANAKNAALYPYNADITILDFNGNIYSSSIYDLGKTYDEMRNQSWFKQTVDMNGYMLWMAPAGQYINVNDFSKGNIAMARLIKGDKGTGGYGVLLISLYPEMKLASMLETVGLQQGTHLFVMNDAGSVILADDLSMVGHRLEEEPFMSNIISHYNGSFTMDINEQRMAINYYTVPKVNWKVVQMIPYDVLMRETEQLRSYNIVVNGLFAVGLVMVAVLLSSGITRPLYRLSLLMKEVPKGNFKVKAPVKGNDEVAQLSNSFNIMVQQMDELIKQLEEEHKMRERAHLEALQAQINPHFLFNTLNGIKWMATINGADNVGQMIAALGRLLETTVGKNEEMITLSEEIRCVDSYILLQKMRYGDKFDIQYNMDDEILSYRIPRLILQPLVENAIIHGFEDMESGGVIIINGHKQSDSILIEVTDNGKGISVEKMSNILEDSNDKKGRFSNIGLNNVNDRIKLHFGGDYGLTISSHEGIGTTVQMRLPLYEGGMIDAKTADSR